MTLTWRYWRWKLWLASLLAMRGALASSGDCVLAQIIPDGTLGASGSVVTPTNIDGLPTDQIDGGATRGANLFHSFEQFSVPTGSAAYFNNALDIQNIISRVTGSSISNIDGLIRANGTANLFLLNPNGTIFGPNASLNIGGSFLASTASAINFADGTQFNATAPQTTPLLTVSVPLGLQFGGTTPGSILNQSRATNRSGQLVGLQVPQGKTFALVGGDVRLVGGRLQAPGGLVELGGIAGAGTVGLNVEGNNLYLSFPNGASRADVSLTNRARVNVTADDGGSIAINARNLDVLGESRLLADTLQQGNAGRINILATDSVLLNNSEIASQSRNQGGDVYIQAGSRVSLTNNSSIEVASGGGGSITIRARNQDILGDSQLRGGINLGRGTPDSRAGDIVIDGIDATGTINIGESSTVQNRVNIAGNRRSTFGSAGAVIIKNAHSLTLTDSQILVDALGNGNAGSVDIDVRDAVNITNTEPAEGPSGIVSSVVSAIGLPERGGQGKSGDIRITARSLSLTNGAQINAQTLGRGDAGNVVINVHDTVLLDGVNNEFASQISSAVGPGGTGQGGDIIINGARSLSLRNGALLDTSTSGSGRAGRVLVQNTDSVSLSNSSLIRSTTGAGTNESRVINILDDSSISINVTIAQFSSAVGSGETGQSGDIIINGVRSLSLTGGAQLTASTTGRGDAGNIQVNTTDAVNLSGTNESGKSSGLFANTSEGAGAAGDLTIETGQLTVRDGAEVSVSSRGSGKAGNLQITARSIRLNNGGAVTATTLSGNGGDIKLQAQDLLLLRRNSNISSTAGTAQAVGNGGNIDIDTKFLIAVPSENSDITANAFTGNGGRVQITAQGIFGTQFREDETPLLSDITASSSFGVSGTVEINTPDVDPSQGLATLPAELVEASRLIATGCAADGENKFIVIGRGGLPPNPGDTLTGEAVLTNWATLDPEVEKRSGVAPSTNPTSPTPTQIVEAQGWVINNKGEVVLTATAPNVTPNIPWMTPAQCHAPETSL